jgi:peptidyl-prolyl cis-trans isomerase A (cyclophilin A)
MIGRIALLALSWLAAQPAIAQTAPPSAPTVDAAPAVAPLPKPATVRVTLQTSEGPIVLELEKERAPITTANFLHYVDQKRFDGIGFYRAAKMAPDFGLVQAGIRDPRKTFPPIAHEPTSKTGLSHVDGTISMARNAPGTAGADFFIIVGDMPSLDADPKQPGDNLGFAAFGHVVVGMDIVHHILDAPKSPTLGEGVMKGQMLSEPIRILTARRGG